MIEVAPLHRAERAANRTGGRGRSFGQQEQRFSTPDDSVLRGRARCIRERRGVMKPANEDHSFQALILDRVPDAFGAGVQVLEPRREPNTLLSNQPTKLCRVLAVAIDDQVPIRPRRATFKVRQVAPCLKPWSPLGNGKNLRLFAAITPLIASFDRLNDAGRMPGTVRAAFVLMGSLRHGIRAP